MYTHPYISTPKHGYVSSMNLTEFKFKITVQANEELLYVEVDGPAHCEWDHSIDFIKRQMKRAIGGATG